MEKNKNWDAVFEAHPTVEEIFVVGDMPFLRKAEAENYAKSIAKKVEAIKKVKAEKVSEKKEV